MPTKIGKPKSGIEMKVAQVHVSLQSAVENTLQRAILITVVMRRMRNIGS